jgi:hypothetical protein
MLAARGRLQLNSIKPLGVVLLCSASLALLMAIVLPRVALLLGLGIDVPLSWRDLGIRIPGFYS